MLPGKSTTPAKMLARSFHPGTTASTLVDPIAEAAAKTGALGSAGLIEAVGNAAAKWEFPLVVDPVLISKHGAPLMDQEAQRALAEHLVPRAFLLTPNLEEAAVLAGFPVTDLDSMRKAAEVLASRGAKNVRYASSEGHVSKMRSPSGVLAAACSTWFDSGTSAIISR